MDADVITRSDSMEFFATCPLGFEHLLQDELASLGARQARALKGQASFVGDLACAYHVCLWSRLASRVVLVLARVDAADSDVLYQGLSQIDWSEHIAPGATFDVDAHGTNAALRNSQFVALRTKDAIVDQLLARTGTRPQTDTGTPDVEVVVRLSRERASVGINLSGEPLFRRGTEAARSKRSPIAPLRADYAAAMLAQGGWFRRCRAASHDEKAIPTLLALYPGAGTILAEAASQALDRAPGLVRARWGFEGWAGHDADAWGQILEEARERADRSAGRPVMLLATDGRKGASQAASQLLHAAGIHDVSPRFLPAEDAAQTLAGLIKAHEASPDALAACDLSWIEEGDVAVEARALADASSLAAGLPAQAEIVSLSRSGLIDQALSATPSETLETVVGRDKQALRLYPAGSRGQARPQATIADADGRQVTLPLFVAQSDQFASRLRKVWRERKKWARREDVSCYRIYDADLPDYAVSIDLFEGSELLGRHDGKRGRWLQVYEYQAPKDVDPELARRRLLDVVAIAPVILGVRPENVFVRTRAHGRGGSQYAEEARGTRAVQDRGHAGRADRQRDGRQAYRAGYAPLPSGAHLVDEGGLTFEVNFSMRLDCGLFLDHRDTRSMVRELMKKTKGSKRFLNLFAYTGTATCYAADGGAKHTTTVDMSAPSLDWARRNMARNGFIGPEHQYVRADVIDWVGEQRHTRNRWDLVFCDVPTFSNSKGMRHGSWDVQRDHAELLIGVSRLLTQNGCCLFSCNLRSFKPDVAALAKAGVEIEDITDETIPEDFSRNKKIHHAYLVRRTPRA